MNKKKSVLLSLVIVPIIVTFVIMVIDTFIVKKYSFYDEIKNMVLFTNQVIIISFVFIICLVLFYMRNVLKSKRDYQNKTTYRNTLPKNDLYLDKDYNLKLDNLYHMIYMDENIQNIGVVGGIASGKSSIINSVLKMKSYKYHMSNSAKVKVDEENIFWLFVKCDEWRQKVASAFSYVFSKRYEEYRISFKNVNTSNDGYDKELDKTIVSEEFNQRKRETIQEKEIVKTNENSMELKYLELCTMQLDNQVRVKKIKRLTVKVVYASLSILLLMITNDIFFNGIKVQDAMVSKDTLLYDISELLTSIFNSPLIGWFALLNILIVILYLLVSITCKLYMNFTVKSINVKDLANVENSLTNAMQDQLEFKSMQQLIKTFNYMSFSNKVVIIEDVDRNGNVTNLISYLTFINKILNFRYNGKDNRIKNNYKFIYAISSDKVGNKEVDGPEFISKVFDAMIYVDSTAKSKNMYRFFRKIVGDDNVNIDTATLIYLCKHIGNIRLLNLVAQEFLTMKNLMKYKSNEFDINILYFSILKVSYPFEYNNIAMYDKYAGDLQKKNSFSKNELNNSEEASRLMEEISEFESKNNIKKIIRWGIDKNILDGFGRYLTFTNWSIYDIADAYLTEISNFDKNSMDDNDNTNYKVDIDEESCIEIINQLDDYTDDKLSSKGINFSLIKYMWFRNDNYVEVLKGKLFYSIINYTIDSEICYFYEYLSDLSVAELDALEPIVKEEFGTWFAESINVLYKKDLRFDLVYKNAREIEFKIKGEIFTVLGEEEYEFDIDVLRQNKNEQLTNNEAFDNNYFIVEVLSGKYEHISINLNDIFNNNIVVLHTMMKKYDNSLMNIFNRYIDRLSKRYEFYLLESLEESWTTTFTEQRFIDRKERVEKSQFDTMLYSIDNVDLSNYAFCSSSTADDRKDLTNTLVDHVKYYFQNSFSQERITINSMLAAILSTLRMGDIVNVLESELTNDDWSEVELINDIFDKYVVSTNTITDFSMLNVVGRRNIVINVIKSMISDGDLLDEAFNIDNTKENKLSQLQITGMKIDIDIPGVTTLKFEIKVKDVKAAAKINEEGYNFDYYENDMNFVNEVSKFALYVIAYIDSIID